MSGPGAAWYPDPHDGASLRWWDGNRWTEHTHSQVVTTPATTAVATIPVPATDTQDRFASVMPSIGGAPVTSRPPATPLPHTGLTTTASPGRLLPPPDATAHPRRRWWRIRRAGVAFLAIILVGLGAYGTGFLDRLTVSEPTRNPSSPTVKVHEDSGYSFEVPNFWVGQSVDDTSLDYRFDVLGQSSVGVASTRVPSSVDPADPAVQAFLFDTAARGFQLELGGIPPTSTAPFPVDGAVGQQVVVAAPGADGQPMDAGKIRLGAFLTLPITGLPLHAGGLSTQPIHP